MQSVSRFLERRKSGTQLVVGKLERASPSLLSSSSSSYSSSSSSAAPTNSTTLSGAPTPLSSSPNNASASTTTTTTTTNNATTDKGQASPDGVDTAFAFFQTGGGGATPTTVAALPHHSHAFQPPVFTAASNALDAERKRHELVDHEASEEQVRQRDLLVHAQHAQQHAHHTTPTTTTTASSSTPLQQTQLRGATRLPGRLPDVQSVLARKDEYVGPTRESNWVILDHLMVGAYPSSFDDNENDAILSSILECGVTTFVCLQQEYQHGVSEALWRAGSALRPYIEDAMDICARERDTGRIVAPEHLKFLHTGIVDCGVTTDATVLELAIDICFRLVAGEVIYLHCWGGHGRTGTVVAVALGLLYGVSSAEALARTQLYHDLRICSLNVPSPQTPQQRRQVERILDAVHRGEYGSAVPPIPIIRPTSPVPFLPSPRFVKPIKGRRSSLSSDASSLSNNNSGSMMFAFPGSASSPSPGPASGKTPTHAAGAATSMSGTTSGSFW